MWGLRGARGQMQRERWGECCKQPSRQRERTCKEHPGWKSLGTRGETYKADRTGHRAPGKVDLGSISWQKDPVVWAKRRGRRGRGGQEAGQERWRWGCLSRPCRDSRCRLGPFYRRGQVRPAVSGGVSHSSCHGILWPCSQKRGPPAWGSRASKQRELWGLFLPTPLNTSVPQFLFQGH